MPYELRGKCVVRSDTGETVPGGCHDTQGEAQKHLAALMANVPDAKSAAADVKFPLYPPSSWFTKPDNLERAQKFTVVTAGADAGRVFGYVAPWGQCLLGGDPRDCFMAPSSPSRYAAAHQGDTVTAEGDVIRTANIGGGINHAPLFPAEFSSKIVDHYANTASQVARVVYGEDDYGIWAAGALWPDVHELDVAKARASALSGDWRWRPEFGAYDMAGSQLVSVPGFPLMRGIAASCEAHPILVGGMGGIPPELENETPAIVPAAMVAHLTHPLEGVPSLEDVREARMAEPCTCHTGRTAAGKGEKLGKMIDALDDTEPDQGDAAEGAEQAKGEQPEQLKANQDRGEAAQNGEQPPPDGQPPDPNAPPEGGAVTALAGKVDGLEQRLAAIESTGAQAQQLEARMADTEAAIAELSDGLSNVNRWLADVAASSIDDELAQLDEEQPPEEPKAEPQAKQTAPEKAKQPTGGKAGG